jgi:peptidoglycan/LPS O-acetylase OafA/YrhL
LYRYFRLWKSLAALPMDRIKELDTLRALAIGAVFLVHFRPVHHPVFNFMSFGWAGVDLFFVISGFLITSILLRLRDQPDPLKQFYWRRALRILPPYYLALCAILLLARLHGEEISASEKFQNFFFLTSLDGLSLKLMLSRLLFHTDFRVPTLLLDFHHYVLFERGLRVFWSLSVEEFFYLFWAPIVLKGSKRLITFCSFAPLLICPFIRALSHTSAFFETGNFFARFDSLSIGACVALLFLAVKRGAIPVRVIEIGALIAAPVSALALALLAWRCGVLRDIQVKSTLTFAVFGYSLIAVFCASLVAACVRWTGTKFTRILRLGPLVYLGSISYMLYLIHLPVFVALGVVLNRFGHVPYVEVLQGPIAVMITIGTAALSWKYFESPILKFKGYKFGSAVQESPLHKQSPPLQTIPHSQIEAVASRGE